MINFSRPSNVTAPSQVVAAIEEQPMLSNSTQQINEISNIQGGFLVCFLFFCYLCVGLWYKKRHEARVLDFREQIETLERIWCMREYRR